MNYEQMLAPGDRSKAPLSVRLKPFWSQDVMVLTVGENLPPVILGLAENLKAGKTSGINLVGWWNGRPFLGSKHGVVCLKEDVKAGHFPGAVFVEPCLPTVDSPPPFTVLSPASAAGVGDRPLAINIRGTSGSGKSHLVRSVMDKYKDKTPMFVQGRKRPMYYKLQHPAPGGRELCVLGHYESPCGGCDTIQGTDLIFNTVKELVTLGYDVLFEGLLISIEVNRTNVLAEAGITRLHLVCLDTPLQTCLDSINARRQARGKTEPVPPANTESKHKGVVGCQRRLNSSVQLATLGREEALAYVCKLLGVS